LAGPEQLKGQIFKRLVDLNAVSPGAGQGAGHEGSMGLMQQGGVCVMERALIGCGGGFGFGFCIAPGGVDVDLRLNGHK